jgi:putative nucleotidyltransferase with HDIG domain
MRWVVITSCRTVTGGLTGLLVVAAQLLTKADIGSIVIGTAAGALFGESLDVLFTAATYRLRGRGRMLAVVRSLAPLGLAAVPLYTPVVVLLALAYQRLSPWTLLLFFVPALAAHRVFGMYQEQRQLAEDLASVNLRLEGANLSFATALVATLDARDRYTAGHSAAVAIYARDIAARMGLDSGGQQSAHLCGLVHDIGKVGLPPGLLEKPEPLLLEERRQMQKHSEIGEYILAKVKDYQEIAAIVRHHHERWDGQGYPDGIGGAEIPLLSRITAVADAYNAMTSARPYRDAMPSRVARMRLAQAVETQFDTTVVAAFEAILAGASEDYQCGTRADFSLSAQDPWGVEAAVAAA